MSSRDNNSNLYHHKMFSVLKEGLSDSITKTQNILVCKDDVLYVWHAAENCILTLHLKTFELEEHKDFQRLLLTQAPNFTVDRILINPLSTLALLAGPKGICVLRLPRRTGAFSLFQGGKASVLCKSQMVEERLFATQCDVYQLAWHPGSNSDAHIFVLCSDNTLRLFDLTGPYPEKICVYPLGKRHSGPVQSQLNNVLGDNIVAFTFGRPFVKNQSEKNDNRKDIEWPLLLLKGSGDICTMDGTIYNRSTPPQVLGPLPMYPPADDNYGVESCSILQLGSHLIVVATCSGILYHCVILPQDTDSEKEVSNPSSSSKNCLFVVEAIELDLGLSLNDTDTMYSCPIYLIPDEGVKNRYFCTHETGVHIITVPIVNQLEEFFTSSDADSEVSLPSFNQSSSAEYAICTKTSKSNSVNPPLGFTVSYSPYAFLTILSSGDMVRRTLGMEPAVSDMLFSETFQHKDKTLLNSELNSSLKEMQKMSFDNHIRQILKHEMSQPILKTAGNGESNLKECFELFSHATHIFHEEYITKLERARKELERRVATLRLLKEHQMQECEELKKCREDVHRDDEKIRQKCNDIIERQKELNKRCSNVLHGIRIKNCVQSIAEKEMLVDLKNYQNKTNTFLKQFENMKKKIKYREQQSKEWENNKSKKEIFLGKNHMDIIKSTMEKQTEQIKDIINQINHLKLDLSMI